MKKYLIYIVSLILAFVSCKEWEPVFNQAGDKPIKGFSTIKKLEATHTISELVAMYKEHGKPFTINSNVIIKGAVVSSDKSGNFYKSLFLQDETGGIEVKIGRNGLYNDYQKGSVLAIKCAGLTLGEYGFKDNQKYGGNGMVSLGFEAAKQIDEDGTIKDSKYENSYMEVTNIINSHLYPQGEDIELKPYVIKATDLPTQHQTLKDNKYIGSLVTIEGLKYSSSDFFVLLYLDYNKDTKAPSNRVFLTGNNWGVTTWAMSKVQYLKYLESGAWDKAEIGSGPERGFGVVGDEKNKLQLISNASPVTVSQGFKLDGKVIQVRTSGYCKFADLEIPEEVLKGKKTVSVTGILGLYQGKIQFTLLDENSIVIK